MNKKCDLNLFFNEFNITLDLKYNIIPFYNGFYSAKNYEKNLNQEISNYKHDLLYLLPLCSEGKPEILLKNLHDELSKKRNCLSRYIKYVRKKRNTNPTPNIFNLRATMDDIYKRRNSKMQNKQLLILRNAICITEQALSNFNHTIEEIKDIKNETKEVKSHVDIVWNDDKLGLIQLIKSLIKVKAILIGPLRENDAIKKISELLNISIDRNNFSSVSRAIHSNNSDYKPEIFGKIIDGYEIIAHERRERLEKANK